MEPDLIGRLEALPDGIVLAGAERLAASHHRNVADLVAHVAVVDSRLLFAPRFSSLFRYCCGALSLSEGAAANLIETARAAPRYPVILALLRDGSINPPPSPPAPAAAPSARAAVVPLSPARYSYKLTIDEDTRRLLLQARELTSHAIPGGDDLAVLKRAPHLLVRQQLKKRFGLASRPGRKASAARKGSRHIPVQVARAVYERDGGACAWVGPPQRTPSDARLQSHLPRAEVLARRRRLRCWPSLWAVGTSYTRT
jgi:hypothetical protein